MKENLKLVADWLIVACLVILIVLNIPKEEKEKDYSGLENIPQAESFLVDGKFYNPYPHQTEDGKHSIEDVAEYFDDGQTEVVADKYLKTIDVDRYTGIVYIIYQYEDSISVTPYLLDDGSVYSVYTYYNGDKEAELKGIYKNK